MEFVTNTFELRETGDSPCEFFVYRVTFTPPCAPGRAAASVLHTALFPGQTDNPDCGSTFLFDGFDSLMSPVAIDISCEAVRLEPQGKVSLQNDFVRVVNMFLSKSLSTLGYSCLDKGWFNGNECEEVGAVRIVRAVRPSVSRSGLTFSSAVMASRRGHLYEFLEQGIRTPSMRGDLERATKATEYGVIGSPSHSRIRVAAVYWPPNDDKKVNVTQPVKEDDPIVEADDGSMFPASCLTQIGLTAAEMTDKVIVEKFEAAKNEDSEKAKARIDNVVAALRSDEVRSLWESFGLVIGEEVKMEGKILERPMLTVREKSMRKLIEVQAPKDGDIRYDVSERLVVVAPKFNKQPVLLVDESLELQVKRNFVPKLLQTACELGVSMMQPNEISVRSTNASSLIDELKRELKQHGLPAFVLVVARDPTQSDFAIVRRFLAVDLGVPVQFISGRTIADNVPTEEVQSLVRKLVIQTGGVPDYVSLPLQSSVAIGVCTQDGRTFSVSGSIDHTLARYRYDLVSFENVSDFVNQTCSEFTKMTSVKPTRLLVYATIVGDHEEFKQKLLDALQPLSLNLTICRVESDETFQPLVKIGDSYDTPPPGTLIYDGKSTEFLLKSTKSSTSRYTLLHTDFDITRFITVTFGLCCNYMTDTAHSSDLPAPLMVAQSNLDYCRTWLQGQPPAASLKDSMLHFI